MTFGSLFSGIGGIDLGLTRAGMQCRWQVEVDQYALKVLARHWPNVPKYRDVRFFLGGKRWRRARAAWKVDLIAGGFPCQPVSLAGRRRGQEDERWLWPEFARVIRLLRPRYLLMENVPGLLVRGMGDVLGDLSALGYDAEWQSLPAAAFGAPHLRWRVFLVGYANGSERGARAEGRNEPDGDDARREETTNRPAAPGPNGRSGNLVLADADGQRQQQSERLLQQERRRVGNGSEAAGDAPRGGRRAGPMVFPDAAHFDPASLRTDWWDAESGVCMLDDGTPGRVGQLAGYGNAVVPQIAEYVGRLILAHETLS